MCLHDLKFFIGQPSRLQKNGIRNTDLSHIMQHRRPGNCIHLDIGQPVPGEMVHQTLCHNPGVILNTLGMVARLRTSGLHNGTKGINHKLVCLTNFFFLCPDGLLLLFQADFHIPFVLIQFDDITASSLDNIRIEGLMYNVCHSERVCPAFTVLNGFAGNQYDRNPFQEILFLHILQNLKSIHDRHDNIQQNQHDILIAFNLMNRFLSILCLN